MNREILFRGKREYDGEWVYGDLLKHTELGLVEIGHVEYYTDEYYTLKDYCRTTVIPETVGQYTGLVDRNGTKIFDGDICSTDLARPYAVVEFRNGCFVYEVNDGNGDYYDIMMPIERLVDVDEYVEVIGNIHEQGVQ